jgi:hypothetical protein
LHSYQETVQLGIDLPSRLDVDPSRIRGRAATLTEHLTAVVKGGHPSSRFYDESIFYLHRREEMVYTAVIKAKDSVFSRPFERIASITPGIHAWYKRLVHTEIAITKEQYDSLQDVTIYQK